MNITSASRSVDPLLVSISDAVSGEEPATPRGQERVGPLTEAEAQTIRDMSRRELESAFAGLRLRVVEGGGQ